MVANSNGACASLATTVPGGCIPWRSFPNVQSVGANRDDSARTLDACQALCIGNQRCVAVDWDTNVAACWVHTNPSNLLRRYGATGITQYQLTRCPGATTTTTGTHGPV